MSTGQNESYSDVSIVLFQMFEPETGKNNEILTRLNTKSWTRIRRSFTCLAGQNTELTPISISKIF